MDVAGTVVDKGTSSKYEIGDRIMGIGSVGWSDGGSFQSHVLIHERDTCKVKNLQKFLLSQR
jgi:NADPH:quinone reductase-like Zn-dependent oxidoreductase